MSSVSTDFNLYKKSYENRSPIINWFRYLAGIENRAISTLFKRFEDTLDGFEKDGIKFHTNRDSNYKYYQDIQVNNNVASELVQWVKERKFTKFEKTLEQVNQKIVASRYRLKGMINTDDPKSENAKYDPDTEYHKSDFIEKKIIKSDKDLETQIQENTIKLLDLATKWKQSKPFWKKRKNKELDYLQRNQIIEAAQYVKWVPLILKDAAYRDKFFKWALQDFNSVEVFITCPATTENIRKAVLHGAIGRIHKDAKDENYLCFAEEKFKSNEGKVLGTRRYLTLPFYTGIPKDLTVKNMNRIDILDPEREVTFCGGVTLKIREIFEKRSRVNEEVPDVKVTAYGLMFYKLMKHKTIKSAYWDINKKEYVPIIDISDENKEKWYKDLPPTTVVTEKFLKERYGKYKEGKKKGQEIINGIDPFVEYSATRSDLSRKSTDAHGFSKLYFPVGDINGNGENYYHVVDIGKFGDEYANGVWKSLKLFCGTILGLIMLGLDPNGLYSHRELATIPEFPTKEKLKEMMEDLRLHLLKEIYFQFVTENCSGFIEEWAHKHFPELPPLFTVGLFSGQGGMKYIDGYLKFFEKCHRIIQFLSVLPILLLAFAWRWVTIKEEVDGKEVCVRKSVFKNIWNRIMYAKSTETNPKANPVVTNPTGLFYLEDEEYKKRVKIRFGNTEEWIPTAAV